MTLDLHRAQRRQTDRLRDTIVRRARSRHRPTSRLAVLVVDRTSWALVRRADRARSLAVAEGSGLLLLRQRGRGDGRRTLRLVSLVRRRHERPRFLLVAIRRRRPHLLPSLRRPRRHGSTVILVARLAERLGDPQRSRARRRHPRRMRRPGLTQRILAAEHRLGARELAFALGQQPLGHRTADGHPLELADGLDELAPAAVGVGLLGMRLADDVSIERTIGRPRSEAGEGLPGHVLLELVVLPSDEPCARSQRKTLMESRRAA